MLVEAGAPTLPDDPAALGAIRQMTERLRDEADRSAVWGILALPLWTGLAVRAACMLYHVIIRDSRPSLRFATRARRAVSRAFALRARSRDRFA